MSLKVTISVSNLSTSKISGNVLFMNRKAHVACNFKSFVGLLKVTGSHVRCKCGNISETVQDEVVVKTLIGSDVWPIE